LDHLEGYRGSRPVHTGNEAAEQRQPDIHGELLDAGYELVRNGYELEPDIRGFLPAVADRGARDWRKPDHGLWEMPLEPKQYVYSKMMICVALDHAIRLADDGLIEGDTAPWAAAREDIRTWVLGEAYREDLGT